MRRFPYLKFQPVAIAGAGTNDLVAAVAGKRIVLRGFLLAMTAAGTVQFLSAANVLSGVIPWPASPVDGSTEERAVCETNIGEALRATTVTGGLQGIVVYSLED